MEPPKSVFKPINFIVNGSELENYECIICTQKSITLMQCRVCKICLCNLCAIDQQVVNNKCPYRCSEGDFKLSPISNLKVQFRCPFSLECKNTMKNVKQFYQHDRECQFIDQKQKQQQMRKWDFRCLKNHSLEIYNDVFKNLTKRKKCGQCGQFSTSRVQCRKCDEFFCGYCRPFPINDMKCLADHQFSQRNIRSKNYRCDGCEQTPVTTGQKYYDDKCCNFSLCQICFKNSPTFKKVPSYCVNLNSYCEIPGQNQIKNKLPQKQYLQLKQKHKLTILNERSLQKCSWCLKQQLCYKKCIQCDKYFCFGCKIFDIMQNNQCQLQHQVYQTQKKDNQKIQCYSCNKKFQQNDTIWKDDKCKVTICTECLQKLKNFNYGVIYRNFYNNMPKCLWEDHVNFYNPANRDYQYYCTKCGNYKRIKIVCLCCETYKRYCCECLPPININLCYCGRVLKKLGDNQCLLCSQMKQDIYGCGRCNYTICGGCIKQRQQSKQEDKKMEEIT